MSTHDPHGVNEPTARELGEPTEGNEPAPLFVWLSIFGLILFGVIYFTLYTGDGSVAGGDMRSPVMAAGEAEAPKKVNGAAVYNQTCAACHQANGTGVAGTFPPLAGASWVTGDEATLARIILMGVEGPLEVNGTTYNGVMPPWRDVLNDEQIAAVMTHIRSQWGNDAPAVSPETVAALRAEYQGRAESWQGGAELLAEANR